MDLRTPGFTRFSRFGANLGRLHVTEATHTEGLDGTDSLEVTCYEDLDKNDYIVWRDRQGKWHEHIVDSTKRTHDDNGTPMTAASCINSIAETWDDWVDDKRPSGTVTTALEAILATSRWNVGPCTHTATASHTFYHENVREAIQELVEVWGGELETTITCDGNRVTSRAVGIQATRGNQQSAKRFTWSKDLREIAREVASDNPKSRIYAYGKGEETDSGGYGRRISIDSVNDGKPYVEDAEATQLWGRPDGSGGIAPSCGVYLNESCADPAQLKAEALKALDAAKVPVVTYTADVIDLVSFGRDWEEVGLGDLVTIIDKEFSETGLRLSGRVSKLSRDLLTYDTTVTFGNLVDAIANPWQAMQTKIATLSRRSGNWDLAGEASVEWLELLISSLNARYNSVGTYHFESFEQGEIWSNVPLDENGRATRSGGWAMNINGLGFRLASGTKPDGSWDWRVFGNGEGFTAEDITAGVLHSAGYETYINLITGEAQISGASKIGSRTVTRLLQDVDATITDVDVEYAEAPSDVTPPASGWGTTAPAWREGYYIWQRTATTTASGTTYSTPVMISGKNGANGTGISSTTTTYGTSDSASTAPTVWLPNAPTSIATGRWLWVRTVTTYTDGTDSTTYTKSYAGTDGHDGTSVTILGSYNTLAELQADHPTGNLGDSYIVAGDLYVWDGDSWENVGQIQGPAGRNGTSVTVSRIEYGTSASAATQPSSWSTTVPTSIAAGRWLWVKTTYSDSSTATTKSYVGTDGADGKYVAIKSSSKNGRTTTVVLEEVDPETGTRTERTLTITDGEDGPSGTPGANGYVHTAWANSADGRTDFSTTVSTGKSYLGVYTDNTEADSTYYGDYSWSLIKGADGADAYTYTLNCSPAALVRTKDGTLTPSSITFSATRAQGTGNPTAYAGRFTIEEFNGTNWATKTYSTADESSRTYSPTSTAKIVRCTLHLAGGRSTTLDVQSVPIAQDGATGGTGASGADAYTVILTNEAHTFAAGTSAAIASTATSYVVAYKGADQVAATIGTITGAPQGMSATIFNNGTTSARFAVSVSNLLTTKQGVLSVPITVDGHIFTRTFSWSLALSGEKGDKGDKGDTGNNGQNGVGVGEIVEQYYLSTSSTTQSGGSWSTNQPAWESGKYIWTRSKITWSDEQVTYTDPVLAKAVNGANQSAATAQTTAENAQDTAEAAADAADDAKKVATNYLTFSTSTGLDVGYDGSSAKTRINGSGLEVFDGDGKSALFAGLQSSKSIVRVGRATGSGNIVMSSDGYVDIRNASTVMAHFGYGVCKDIYGNSTSKYPYYVLGEQSTDTSKLQGQHSLSGGYRSIAGPRSIAWGTECDSSDAIDAIALGNKATVKKGNLAIGTGALANAAYASAIGLQVQAEGNSQFVIGKYNATSTSHLFIVGCGGYSARASAFYVTSTGSAWLKGTLTQSSDRRLKEHHAYLSDDACEFIRKLKPALYTKDGERHLGFYAQDVQEAEPDEWDTVTVTAQHTDESLDFNPLALDYTALIAPLVAYAQQLEKRIDQQQAQLDALTKRLEALEAK